MKTSGNTILITGGATGIGFALAEAFVKSGNEVIICGRRDQKLKEAKVKIPQVHIRTCDLANEKERQLLFDWVSSNFKGINILVNNAGVQKMVDFNKGTKDLLDGEDEIETNLKAYIYLAAYFIPSFLEKKEAAIVNISSGLAYVPLAAMPVYCATKAAVHSFSVSLRYQLRDTDIKVFEILPPIVDTELDKGSREERGQDYRGMQPDEVAGVTLSALENDEYEVAIGLAQYLKMGSRNSPEQTFKNMNG